MALPAELSKRETISNYVDEAVSIKRQIDVLKLQLKENMDSVKESEDHLEITLAEYKQAVEAEYQYEKQQEKIDKLQTGIDIVDQLKGK